jgi:hypothetical protein
MKLKIIKKFPGGPEVGSINSGSAPRINKYIFDVNNYNGFESYQYEDLVPEYAEIIEE